MDIESEVQKQINRLKALKYMKNVPHAKLLEMARKNVNCKIIANEIDIGSLFGDSEEKKAARGLLAKYLEDFTPRNISEKNDLRSLLYLEIIQVRLQNVINRLSTKDEKGKDKSLPLQMLDYLHKNAGELAKVKQKLGLTRDTKKVEENDGYVIFQKIVEKAKVWREQNQASRFSFCPHCGKEILWKIKREAWEAQKHPFFQDRILCNEHLLFMYFEKKIVKEDIRLVLQIEKDNGNKGELNTDYVDWLIEKAQSNPKFRKYFIQTKVTSNLKSEEIESGQERNKEGGQRHPERAGTEEKGSSNS